MVLILLEETTKTVEITDGVSYYGTIRKYCDLRNGQIVKYRHGKWTLIGRFHENPYTQFTLKREWKDGVPDKDASYTSYSYSYEGEFRCFEEDIYRNISCISDKCQEGKGILSFRENGRNRHVYIGEFHKGKYHGSGRSFYVDELKVPDEDGHFAGYASQQDRDDDCGTLKYSGGFYEGRYQGEGTLFHCNEKRAAHGIWHKGILWSGFSSLYYKNGNLSSEGELKDGKKFGTWKFYYEDGTLESEGEWENDKKQGYHTSYYPNGITEYAGYYVDDLKQGVGLARYESGALLYNGFWQNDIYCGDLSFYTSLEDIAKNHENIHFSLHMTTLV